MSKILFFFTKEILAHTYNVGDDEQGIIDQCFYVANQPTLLINIYLDLVPIYPIY